MKIENINGIEFKVLNDNEIQVLVDKDKARIWIIFLIIMFFFYLSLPFIIYINS